MTILGEERTTVSVQTASANQVFAQIRPLLERLERLAGAESWVPTSFHQLCTTLGIAYGVRPGLWQVLVQRGYVTDEGNGAVCITEQGSRVASPSRR